MEGLSIQSTEDGQTRALFTKNLAHQAIVQRLTVFAPSHYRLSPVNGKFGDSGVQPGDPLPAGYPSGTISPHSAGVGVNIEAEILILVSLINSSPPFCNRNRISGYQTLDTGFSTDINPTPPYSEVTLQDLGPFKIRMI